MDTDSVGIHVRRPIFPYEQMPKNYAGDPFLTDLLTALSLTFPDGEGMFVRSVRYYLDRIRDPVLKKQVLAFVGQEAAHAAAHRAFNERVRQLGVDTSAIENDARSEMEKGRRLRPAALLAITCALEHFTAILGAQMLRRRDWQEEASATVVRFWLWHAVEENEHKAVAFDVYQRFVGNYRLRIRAMLGVTPHFIGRLIRYQLQLARQDGRLFDLPMWWRGLRRLWGRGGCFRELVPHYFAYFRPDFHPWRDDTHGLIDEWKARLALDEDIVHADAAEHITQPKSSS
jgi:uncharacterized protein